MKIKLRAYCFKEKIWSYWNVEDNPPKNLNSLSDIQRYTGIRAKNRKAIYEGDIIEFKYTVGDFAWEDMDAKERKANSEINGETFTGVVKQKMIVRLKRRDLM